MNHIAPVTIGQSDLGAALRETALLADVTISIWSGERSDPKIMEEAKANAGATGNVGRAIKNLLAGADTALKDCKAQFNQMRNVHYALTLPWVSDPHALRQTGPRLLPNELFFRYVEGMAQQKRKAEAALDVLCLAYPADIVTAQANLGGLARPEDYPSVDEVRTLFKARYDFMPLPASGDFKGLPDAVLGKLGDKLSAQTNRMIQGAQRAMWEEARDRIEHLMSRLTAVSGDEPVRLRKSTLEGVQELLTLLPGWGMGLDPRVKEITESIEDMLAGVRIEDLKKDEIVRGNTVKQAQEVVDKLKSWGL